MRFNEYAALLFERKVLKGDLESAQTRENWELMLRLHLFPAFGDVFVDAISKGDNNNWLDAKRFAPVAARGYAGILREFVVADAANGVRLNGICKVAGLGGDPYRDGSYGYYVGTEVVADDPKGVGAFILASAELGS